MNPLLKSLSVCALFAAACQSPPRAPEPVTHRVLLQGNDRLAVLDRTGAMEWEMPWGGIHDVHRLPNGNVLVQQGSNRLAEIDLSQKQIVWTYASDTQNGNQGKRVEVHSFVPLEGGRVLIAESGPSRLIEIDRAGKLLHEQPLAVKQSDAHRDTRSTETSGSPTRPGSLHGPRREWNALRIQAMARHPSPRSDQRRRETLA